MPAVQTKIWMALKGEVERAAGTIPVAWPSGEIFTPPVLSGVRLPYLTVGFTMLAPERATIGSREAPRREGTLTVVRVAPLGPPLAAHIEAASDLLAAYFREDTGVVFEDIEVSFPGEMNVQGGYRDDGYWRTPVTVRWQARSITF